MAKSTGLWVAIVLLLAQAVQAHGDHSKVPDGSFMSSDPIDAILWLHILLMGVTFGLIFPLGMVLGIVRSRWHVPVQVVGSVIAFVAYFLGHGHKGRQFARNIHGAFASSPMLALIIQIVLGVYLKLHLEKGIHGRVRPYLVKFHGITGKVMPIISWIQMLFGGITALGFCHDDHLGQCLAHFIMGSAFIAYGILLTIVLLVGQFWLRRTGRSQEFFDSLVITIWGCINTFTEHRWGQPWSHGDLQHTSMGIIWWCAGMLGLWLSSSRTGRPTRNLIPALVILLTGYAMSSHHQHLEVSTQVHAVFGYTLMGAGAVRILEISFILKDQDTASVDLLQPSTFQYLTPYLLYASGFLFMGATEEQMQLLNDAGIDHVSYVLVLYSMAFIMFLFVNILLHIYSVNTWPRSTISHSGAGHPGPESSHHPLDEHAHGGINGHARSASHAQQLRDALEYELEGLIGATDKDDEGSPTDAVPSGKISDVESQNISRPHVARL
ncbi:hypothetical protein VTO42DRAFT_5627 [Malbranchea cinnamomea]